MGSSGSSVEGLSSSTPNQCTDVPDLNLQTCIITLGPLQYQSSSVQICSLAQEQGDLDMITISLTVAITGWGVHPKKKYIYIYIYMYTTHVCIYIYIHICIYIYDL